VLQAQRPTDCIEVTIHTHRRHHSTAYWLDGRALGEGELRRLIASYPPSRDPAIRSGVASAGKWLGVVGYLGLIGGALGVGMIEHQRTTAIALAVSAPLSLVGAVIAQDAEQRELKRAVQAYNGPTENGNCPGPPLSWPSAR
jgi:hypothetical protein